MEYDVWEAHVKNKIVGLAVDRIWDADAVTRWIGPEPDVFVELTTAEMNVLANHGYHEM